MVFARTLRYSLKNSNHRMSAFVGLGLAGILSFLARNGERDGDYHRYQVQKLIHVSE